MANRIRNTTSAKPRGERKHISVVPAEAASSDARAQGTAAGSPSPVGNLLLTSQEAVRALSINRSTLYVLLMRGDIPSFKVGRARRIPVRALEEWIARHLVE